MLDLRPLNLKPSEERLLRDCVRAWSLVNNGHYLPALRWKAAAERLIARNFLTKAPDQPAPNFGDWPPVVVLLPANYDAMRAAGATDMAEATKQGES